MINYNIILINVNLNNNNNNNNKYYVIITLPAVRRSARRDVEG